MENARLTPFPQLSINLLIYCHCFVMIIALTVIRFLTEKVFIFCLRSDVITEITVNAAQCKRYI
jgi:hypothetical protein